MAEAFPTKTTKGPAQLRMLLADDVRAEVIAPPAADCDPDKVVRAN